MATIQERLESLRQRGQESQAIVAQQRIDRFRKDNEGSASTYGSVLNAMNSPVLQGLSVPRSGSGLMTYKDAAEQARRAAEVERALAPLAEVRSGSDMLALARQRDNERLEALRQSMEAITAQQEALGKSTGSNRKDVLAAAQEKTALAQQAKAAREAYEQAAAEMGVQTDTQWGKLAGGTVLKGINQFTSSVANTADWLVGTLTRAALGLNQEEYESLNTPTTALKNLQQSEREGLAAAYAENAATSRAASLIDEYGTATVAALPQAILALLSGGQSEVASSASLAGTAATETGLVSTVSNAIGKMIKDPQFGVSFATVAGDSYEKAIEEGASGIKASSYALINGMLNSMVEVSGGVETLPKNLRSAQAESALKEWVFSAIDEGKEEVVQGVIERGLENLVYGKNNPLISASDENAVFNPRTAAKEFVGGVVVGGVLGGGQTVINTAAQKIGDAQLRRAAGAVENGQGAESTAAGTENAAQYEAAESTSVNVDEAVQAGRATTIFNPYEGEKPQYTVPQNRITPSIEGKSLTDAAARISDARAAEQESGQSFRKKLTQLYEQMFSSQGGNRGIAVNGATMDGETYVVTLNKSAIGKIISDKNISPQKLAVLDAIDDVIENGEYVGSGRYIQKGGKQKDTVRFDYFETPVVIDGQSYTVTFDVEVFPSTNNYRTHKVINEMDIVSDSLTDTGTHLPQGLPGQRPFTGGIVAQGEGNVNYKTGEAKPQDFPADGPKIQSGEADTVVNPVVDNTVPQSGQDVKGLLDRAIADLANNGSVSNRTAWDILESPAARATLETEAGLSISGGMTKSQQRAAVKSAVDRYAANIKERGGSNQPRAGESRQRGVDGATPYDDTIPQSGENVNTGATGKATAEDSFAEIAERILSEEQTKTDTQDEKERLRQDFGSFVDMLSGNADPVSDARDGYSAAERAAGKVRTLTEKARTPLGESVSSSYYYIKRKMLDSGEAVQRVAKAVGSKTLYPYYNMARGAGNAAVSMIVDAQTDIRGVKTGKSLNEIMKPIREKGDGYYSAFQQYMLHMHNADRMSRRNEADILRTQEEFTDFKRQTAELAEYAEYQIERIATMPEHVLHDKASEYVRLLEAMRRAENMQNKPVFGHDVTASDSIGAAGTLLGKHPEFEQLAQEVYAYIDGLNRYRVESGLLSEEEYRTLREIYPHYVPVFRTMEEKSGGRKANSVTVGKTIGRAKGGEASIMPMHEALAKQTYSVVREGSKNRFGQMLLDSKAHTHEKGKKHVYEVTEYEGDFSPDSFDADKSAEPQRGNTFTILKDGKRYEMTVSPALFEGIKALSPDAEETNKILALTRGANTLFKGLVTGYNPLFVVKNFARDMQDSWIYSKNLKDFGVNYPQALAQIATNGEYWQQYKALGGISSSIFDYETGNVEEHGKLRLMTVDKIEALNMAVEQAPRLAEFMATVKKGDGSLDNLMEAMYNAADITVNFGRSGTWGKWLNANLIPFLNPGIQGFDKTVRRFSETRGLKEWAGLALRCAAFGFTPVIMNTLLYDDDDEWEIIKDRDKDINYLFKLKNGMWLRLPKGRLLSVLNIIADRATRAMRGEGVDLKEAISTAMSQTMPANPLEENIFKAAFDSDLFDPSSPGKTWYGTDIESKRLQGYRPSERYDEKTDEISKWLGKQLGLSPKKINYLIDQYSGVIGDLLLPMLTLASERNMFSAGFTLDANYSNKLSGAFYDISDELTYAKNDVDATGEDAVVMRYWNKVNSSVSEINAEIRKIEADEELSAKEKRELTREQYALRNAVQKAAIDSLGSYIDAVEKYYAQGKGDESDRTDYAYRMANRDLFGAEYALKAYGKQTYEKAQELHEEGVSYDVFFDAYFGAKDESNALNGKEPPNYQKWRAAINSVDSAGDALDALKVLMNEDEYAKASFAIYNRDISAAAYVTVQEELAAFDKRDQDSVAQAINRVAGLSDSERAVLWQLADLGWKSTNNPFDKEAGEQVLRELKG